MPPKTSNAFTEVRRRRKGDFGANQPSGSKPGPASPGPQPSYARRPASQPAQARARTEPNGISRGAKVAQRAPIRRQPLASYEEEARGTLARHFGGSGPKGGPWAWSEPAPTASPAQQQRRQAAERFDASRGAKGADASAWRSTPSTIAAVIQPVLEHVQREGKRIAIVDLMNDSTEAYELNETGWAAQEKVRVVKLPKGASVFDEAAIQKTINDVATEAVPVVFANPPFANVQVGGGGTSQDAFRAAWLLASAAAGKHGGVGVYLTAADPSTNPANAAFILDSRSQQWAAAAA